MAKNVIRSVLVMLLGLVLIFMSESAMTLLIRVVGVAFLLPALVSIINLYVSRAESGIISKVLISVIDVGSMAFGVWLLASPAYFENIFMKLLAILLVIFVVYQLIMIVAAQRYSVVPFAMYIAPLVLIVFAVILFSVKMSSTSTSSILFGVCALLAGISDLLILLKLKENSSKMIASSRNGAIQKY